MYTRAEVERQIKTKKRWTGKNIITNEEITYIQSRPPLLLDDPPGVSKRY